MTDRPGSGRGVAVTLAAVVIIPLLVVAWLYPATVGPFAAVFLLTGLVMLVRSRRAGRSSR